MENDPMCRLRLRFPVILLFLPLLVCLRAVGQYDPAKIMNAWQTRQAGLTLVGSHRGEVNGSYSNNMPENSIGAFTNAVNAGIEIVEMDVYTTQDHVPYLMHDKTLARMLEMNVNSYYNPDPSGTPGVYWSQINGKVLCGARGVTPVANGGTGQCLSSGGQSVPSLASYMNAVRATGANWGGIASLDIRDTDGLVQAWSTIMQLSPVLLADQVVFKFSPVSLGVNSPQDIANLLATSSYYNGNVAQAESDMAAYMNVQTYYAPNVAITQETSKNNPNWAIDDWNSWSGQRTSFHRLLSPEVDVKGNPGEFMTADTLYHTATGASSLNTIGVYSTYFDCNLSTGNQNLPNLPPGAAGLNGYWTTNGKCVTLNPSSAESQDGIDHRYDHNFITGIYSDNTPFITSPPNFGMILADTAGVLISYLQGINQRNLTPIMSSCRSGSMYPDCDSNSQSTYTLCATEGQTCNFTGDRNIAFGANGSYRTLTMTNSATCNLATFGTPDPAPGIVKSCYYSPPISYLNGIYCGDEDEYCYFQGTTLASIAANGKYYNRTFSVTNGFQCDASTFGWFSDPIPGYVKACFVLDLSHVVNGPQGYTHCAPENGTCLFKGPGRVKFGANGEFNTGVFYGGTPCNVATFNDPASGVSKDCWYQVQTADSGATGTSAGESTGSDGTGPAGDGLNSSTSTATASPVSFPNLPTTPPGPVQGDTYNFTSSNSVTFSVNSGSTSFTSSQPNDSVATYVWVDGGKPTEWLTSANGAALGAQLEYVPVANYAGVNPSASITVNTGTTYQTIDGFGGAMTDSAAYLIGGSSQSKTMLGTLFGTGPGQAGLTIVRSPMGSSDMMASANDIHTYEDTQGNFSVNAFASDQRQISMLQQAKTIAGSNFKLLGTPWSAPGWMKLGRSLLPSQCGTQDNEFDVSYATQYAQYFVGYVNAYSQLGLTPWMISMQNEPENCKTDMPTTLFTANDELTLAKALRSNMPSSVKILGWDHNWNNPDFSNTLAVSGLVDAIGYHCYDGTAYSTQTTAVPTYMTECSGFTASSANVAQNLDWEVANLLIGPLRYDSRGSVYWTMAQDPTGNPHLGGNSACTDCRGMLTVNSDGSFVPSQDLYYWAQLSKFVAPGAVRIDSNNQGPLSTVAFRKGTTNVLVVLNSSSIQANGGSPGSDPENLVGHIVQWDGDTAAQKTAWLVGSDGYRRWISDGSTYNCLIYDAGKQGPNVEAGGALDKYINLDGVWAVCGQVTMGTNSELEVGTYLKSTNGARLTLTSGGLTAVDASGTSHWTPGGAGANRLILQSDGNLVAYQGTTVMWASNTVGSGAVFLSMRDDGTFALFNAQNALVWVSEIQPSTYIGKIVQWEGDTSAQPTSWLVGADGNRRWVEDLPTFQCLHDAGAGNSLRLSTEALNQLPNLQNVWATCGGSQIGPNGALESLSHLSAGNNTLNLQSDGNLVLYHSVNGSGSPTSLWSSNTSGAGGVELKLQPDGNLVLYNAARSSIWASGTDGSNPGYLILGTDASLRLWDASGNNVWSSNPSDVPAFAQAGYNFCAKEGSTCNFVGTARVYFGAPNQAGSTWKDSVTNSISCTVATFGEDPDKGVAKDCWYRLN